MTQEIRPVEDRPTVLVLDALAEGVSSLALAVSADELELQDAYYTFPGPLQVDLQVSRSLQTFLVAGEVHACIRGECCRCLSTVEQPLRSPLRLLLQRQEITREEQEAMAQEEDVEFLHPGTKEVDLKPLICEAVVLELPMRVYCRPECQGLCQRCGHDLNTGPCSCPPLAADPRWAALGELKL